MSIPVLDCGHPPLFNLGGPGSTHHLRPPEPWMKGDILNAIKLRNKSYSEYRKNTNEQQLEKCRKLRNVVNKMITNSKKNFLNENIEANKSNPQKLWEALQQLGCNNKNYEHLHHFKWLAHY